MANKKATLLLSVESLLDTESSSDDSVTIESSTRLNLSLAIPDKKSFTLWSGKELPDDLEQYKDYLDEAINVLSLVRNATELPVSIHENIYTLLGQDEEEVRNYVQKLIREL